MFCLTHSMNKPNSSHLAIYTDKTGLGTEEISRVFIMVVLQAFGCLSFTWLVGLGLGLCLAFFSFFQFFLFILFVFSVVVIYFFVYIFLFCSVCL